VHSADQEHLVNLPPPIHFSSRITKVDLMGLNAPQWRLQITRAWVASLPIWSTEQRNWQLRRAGLTVDPTAVIHPGVLFRTGQVTIGAGSYISDRCVFDGGGDVILGNNVYVATSCLMLTGTHKIGPTAQRAGEHRSAPIVIGDGAWLGAGVIVQPGVTIGAGCVVLPGAVVARDLEPDGMYGGIPCTLVRKLPD
jgi:maltose O-acetyltransferase